MDAIKAVDLTKKYKDVMAVDNLNLQIAQGELFSLLGVNGAGKTTVIKMLSCLTAAHCLPIFPHGCPVFGSILTLREMYLRR